MAPAVTRDPKPPAVKACREGAALGVVLGDEDSLALGVGLEVELLSLPLSSPTVLLLTRLLSLSSLVYDAVMLEPLTQAEGVSVVPSTKLTAEH